MGGIGVILNPYSRSNRKDPKRLEKLSFIVGDRGSCCATQSLADVSRAIERFKENDIDILGISGGDGTLHVTLTELIRVYGDKKLPRIAFLRGGTMNNAANALNIYGSSESLLSLLIYKYHAGEEFRVKDVGLLNVNGSYGFLFGTGLISRFVEAYYRAAPEPTPFIAVKLFAGVAASAVTNGKLACRLFERFDAEVKADGDLWHFRNYSAIAAGTIETFGFGSSPFYRTRSCRGKFQALGLAMTPRQLLFGMVNAFLSRRLHPRNCIDELVNNLEIKFSEPQMYTIDGELLEPTSFISVRYGPVIEVVIP